MPELKSNRLWCFRLTSELIYNLTIHIAWNVLPVLSLALRQRCNVLLYQWTQRRLIEITYKVVNKLTRVGKALLPNL